MNAQVQTPQTDPAPAATPAKTGLPQPVKLYLIGYGILLVLYLAYLFTGSKPLSLDEVMQIAYPGARIDTPAALNEAGSPQGYDKLTIWKDTHFDMPNGMRCEIPGHAQITAYQFKALLAVMMKEQNLPEKERQHIPLYVHKDGTFYNLPWTGVLWLYNIIGLFVLLIVYLRAPINDMLDESAKQAASDLDAARKAKLEAEALKKRYEELVAEVEKEKEKLAETEKVEFAEERERILQQAQHEAKGILENLQVSLEAEMHSRIEALRQEIATAALAQAEELLQKESTEKDHADAFDKFVESVQKVKLA